MADVKWIKITTDIFDDEKILLIESLPDSYAIITVWFKLLCLAGKQNNSGVFMLGRVPYTDNMLATIFRMKEATVTMALKVFSDFGMVEIIDGVITIPNWEKHQSLDKLEMAREQTRARVAKHREKQKLLAECNVTSNVTVTESNADRIDKDKDKDKIKKKSKKEDSLTLFERLWHNYPFTEKLLLKMREWLTYKTERKEEYTEQGLKSLLSRISSKYEEHGDNALCELIDECMANNWKGIIFDRLKDKPKQQGSFDTDSFYNKAVERSLGRAAMEREASERMENKSAPTAEEDPFIKERAEKLKELIGG